MKMFHSEKRKLDSFAIFWNMANLHRILCRLPYYKNTPFSKEKGVSNFLSIYYYILEFVFL